VLRQQTDPSFLDSHTATQIALILGAVAVGAILVAALAFRIRTRWLLAAALVLGVIQLFGPFGFTSGALLVTCTLFPVAFWRTRGVRGMPFVWGLLLGALAIWQAISVLWSEKLGSAGYAVIFSVALLTVFLLALDVVRNDADGGPVAIAAASPVVILSGLIVVLFRLFPQLEGAYLLSPIAPLFSEPDVILVSESEISIAIDPIRSLGVFADVAKPSGSTGMLEGLFITDDLTNFQNVLSPDKAGGVFLNGNTASMFFGVAACVAVWALAASRGRPGLTDGSTGPRIASDSRREGVGFGRGLVRGSAGAGARTAAASQSARRWLVAAHAATAVVSIAALIATGSNTARVLLVGLPILALFIGWAVRHPLPGTLVGAAAVLTAAAGATAVLIRRPDLLTSSTLGDRLGLWRMVAASFPERWFTGFGFGNWRFHIVDEWPHYFPGVATQVWPPHNIFLQAWTDAGMISLLLVLVIMLVPLVAALRRIGEARRGPESVPSRHGSANHSAAPRWTPLFGSDAIARGAVFVGLAWILVHGMADTTNYAGDNHTLPYVALMTAIALTRSRRVSAPVSA
jgi:O-antigen ligase